MDFSLSVFLLLNSQVYKIDTDLYQLNKIGFIENRCSVDNIGKFMFLITKHCRIDAQSNDKTNAGHQAQNHLHKE